MTTTALRRPFDGYGEAVIVATDDGPAFEGDVPDHIGVEVGMLEQLAPAVGGYLPTGDLRLLDVWFRHIGVDGPDIVVFEKVTR